NTINASKLKLVLSKYGDCEMAANGQEALTRFQEAQDAGAPYQLVNLEMDMKDMKGTETAAQIRALETNDQAESQIPLVVLISEAGQQENAAFLEENNIHYLIKPYNRKTLETVLNRVGLEKSAPPPELLKTAAKPPPPKPQSPAADAKVKVILKKMTSIVNNPDRVVTEDFLPMMKELIKNGGKQAELAVGQFITSSDLPITTRFAVMKLAAYIRNPLFLVPLNRVLDTEDNVKVAESALMAIAKYGDQRALTILNNGLKKVKNSMLLNTIRREVAKIKENNPVLAILPRFLQSHKSLKNLRVTLDIMKKIVTHEHSGMFVNYLKSGNPVIEDGTFELLCFAGDPAIKSTIFNFFEDRVQKVPCLAEPECGDLYIQVSHLQRYLAKNPSFADELITEFKELYGKIADIMT
ncbi:MAG: response regulator, partial [bacterium]|nr:response regulator [bacterium]